MGIDDVCSLLLRHDISAVVFNYFGVDEAARLLCSSKRSQQVVRQHLRGTHDAARRLVVDAAGNAARTMASNKSSKSRQSTSADQAMQRFQVLINQDILPDNADIMDDLLHIPHVPAAVAAAVVEVGQRFSYQQLLSSVHATVPGIEVWMRVYRHFHIDRPAGMHMLAEALCCDEHILLQDIESLALPSDTLTDLLHLACAMPYAGTANASLRSLCQLPAAADLSTQTVAGLLKAALRGPGTSGRLLTLLDSIPAAKDIPAEQLTALIQSAAKAKLYYAARALCQSTAAQNVSVDAAKRMLQSAMQLAGSHGVEVLCHLPAAQQLTVQEAIQLMQEALRCKEVEKTLALTGLSPLSNAPAADIADLLTLAVSCESSIKVQALCNLPAAEQIGVAAAGQLLEAAQRCRDPDIASVILSTIPAAQFLELAAIKQRRAQQAVA